MRCVRACVCMPRVSPLTQRTTMPAGVHEGRQRGKIDLRRADWASLVMESASSRMMSLYGGHGYLEGEHSVGGG